MLADGARAAVDSEPLHLEPLVSIGAEGCQRLPDKACWLLIDVPIQFGWKGIHIKHPLHPLI